MSSTPQPDLSRKLYYTISEVSELTEVKPHVLRYWEGEFPGLRPRKGRGGSRRYRRQDIELILEIRSLLYEQGFRIAGARKHLDELKKQQKAGSQAPAQQMLMGFAELDRGEQLAQIKSDLMEIRALLQEAREAQG